MNYDPIAEVRDAPVPDLQAAVVQLQAQVLRFQLAIDNISPGVAFVDAHERLILCSRRYAEVYRLDFDRLRPGMTLRELIELRVAAGTCPMTVDDYISYTRTITSKHEVRVWNITLDDGRVIKVHHQPTPDGGWVSTHEDITDFRDKRLLVEERVSLQSLIDMVPDNLWVKDAESRFVIANVATATRLGRSSPQELIGKSDLELCPQETAQKYLYDETRVLTTGCPMIDSEEYVLTPKGGKLWLATTKAPVRNTSGEIVGVIGVSRDITARRKAEALHECQADILEMIATGASPETVLDSLIFLVESQLPDVVGSMLLLDPDGVHLRHSAAPSLPYDLVRAIDGLSIGLLACSCGSAAYRRKPVTVVDIASDPLWADHRALAVTHGLRSCFSEPILSVKGDVLGVFAMYFSSPRKPTDTEKRLAHVATRLAGISIERERATPKTARVAA